MPVILIMSATTYRAAPFQQAAQNLSIAVIPAVDLPPELAETWHVPLAVNFRQPEQAVAAILSYAQTHPVQAILGLDDAATLVAAQASAALGLPHNDPAAALAARDKHVMRQAMQRAGLPIPAFTPYPIDSDPATLAHTLNYPVVVKPTLLNGSRGVIRANTPAEFIAAWQQTATIIRDSIGDTILVEDYIPGVEVAVEALLTPTGLQPLAIFDKPDPLDGPYFEETIYVTPSRLPADVQAAILTTTAATARAIGLRTGPVHAELRVNDRGVWPIEIAGRSIGGLCSATLRFGPGLSLEELILRQAVGLSTDFEREHAARGVMMIPIPARGQLRAVHGLADAEAVPGIESVEISLPLYSMVVPLPEGQSYLGFIFAHGDHPATVEAALRQAHAHLRFDIEPGLPILNAEFQVRA